MFSTGIEVQYLQKGECKMSFSYISKAEDLENTGFSYTLSLINGKYKMVILYCLMEFEVVRYNEMRKYIKTISYKTLSTMLKELEADGLVHREEYPQIPPKVEYSLTERGKSLIPILDTMCEWGTNNRTT
jgi:DNA-binding HxlR family transcriptional regulator